MQSLTSRSAGLRPAARQWLQRYAITSQAVQSRPQEDPQPAKVSTVLGGWHIQATLLVSGDRRLDGLSFPLGDS